MPSWQADAWLHAEETMQSAAEGASSHADKEAMKDEIWEQLEHVIESVSLVT